MKFKLSILSTLAPLLLLVASCTTSPQEEATPPEPALAVLTGSNAWGCDAKGDRYEFGLLNTTPGQSGISTQPPGMSYYVYLSGTPVFNLGHDCVCRIKHYTLEFDQLPSHNQILVRNQTGGVIPFTGPIATQDGFEAIRIQEKYLQNGLFVGFVGGASPGPQLRYSGGFCIVDNISAPVDQVELVHMEAYREPAFDSETNEEYLAYFLPLTVLTPAGPI